jgi:hypothetical protein
LPLQDDVSAMLAKTLQTVNVMDNYAYDALIARTFVVNHKVKTTGFSRSALAARIGRPLVE